MKKKAKDLKKGDNIKLAGKVCTIDNIEFSEIGKQGSKKARIEAKTDQGERVVVIRPEEFPFESG